MTLIPKGSGRIRHEVIAELLGNLLDFNLLTYHELGFATCRFVFNLFMPSLVRYIPQYFT